MKRHALPARSMSAQQILCKQPPGPAETRRSPQLLNPSVLKSEQTCNPYRDAAFIPHIVQMRGKVIGYTTPVEDRRLDGSDEFDGRTGLQWLASAIAYCEWRAGKVWRNSGDRFATTPSHYFRCLNFLNFVQHNAFQPAAAILAEFERRHGKHLSKTTTEQKASTQAAASGQSAHRDGSDSSLPLGFQFSLFDFSPEEVGAPQQPLAASTLPPKKPVAREVATVSRKGGAR